MRVEEIQQALYDRNLEKVAKLTGISRVTLSNIRRGKNKTPSYRTVVTLENYLNGGAEK